MQEIKRATFLAGMLLGFALLAACRGDGKSDQFAAELTAGCIPVDGSLYKSEEPASWFGLTDQGDAHLVLTFEGGDFIMRAGEFIDEGSYECVNGEYHIYYDGDRTWRTELYDEGESLITALPWWSVPATFIKE